MPSGVERNRAGMARSFSIGPCSRASVVCHSQDPFPVGASRANRTSQSPSRPPWTALDVSGVRGERSGRSLNEKVILEKHTASTPRQERTGRLVEVAFCYVQIGGNTSWGSPGIRKSRWPLRSRKGGGRVAGGDENPPRHRHFLKVESGRAEKRGCVPSHGGIKQAARKVSFPGGSGT